VRISISVLIQESAGQRNRSVETLPNRTNEASPPSEISLCSCVRRIRCSAKVPLSRLVRGLDREIQQSED
jgi:hypothetical protein